MNPMLAFSPSTQQPHIKQPLVLAVDDDDDNLLLLSYAIELFGCRFVGRSSCQAALSFIEECQPDLILMDILLPEVDGISFVQDLRRNPHTRQIPIIAVTALARAEDRETIMLSGFTGYISKPYMLEDLEELIHLCLN